ncbi:MAG: RdgB/HAM1 family non-canonical purine NTP pyrophosphatase [Bdellovibrionota bacterium]
MEIWIATNNAGKIKEYELLFKEIPNLKLHTQQEISGFTARPEDGKTFEENARIKVKSLAAIKNRVWVIGEDSGLEVAGMNGLPGIHSARYAGPKAADSENVTKLLKMMGLKGVTDRKAKFTASLVVATPQGETWAFTGTMEGEIAKAPKGQMGFGYDSVFIPTGQTQTLAELGPGYKTQHSHRSDAAKQFLRKLSEASNVQL